MDAQLKIALAKYMDAIAADYENWTDICHVREAMIAEFKDGLCFNEGKKYIKVISGTSVHSFIVIEDDAKFKRGDILMAASWAAPARNFARGNILGDYKIRWTGAVI